MLGVRFVKKYLFSVYVTREEMRDEDGCEVHALTFSTKPRARVPTSRLFGTLLTRPPKRSSGFRSNNLRSLQVQLPIQM